MVDRVVVAGEGEGLVVGTPALVVVTIVDDAPAVVEAVVVSRGTQLGD